MRAVVVHEFGPPSVLHAEDVDEPAVAAGQMLLAVEAASVVFIETQVRAGEGPNPAALPSLPYVPGNGVGGRVVAVGAGVDPASVGTRVVSTTGGRGGYADLAAVDARDPVPVPEDLHTFTATALLADGRTSVALDACRPSRDRRMGARGGGGRWPGQSPRAARPQRRRTRDRRRQLTRQAAPGFGGRRDRDRRLHRHGLAGATHAR